MTKGREYTMEKDNLFSKSCWENWTITCKRMKSEHSLTSCTKINSKYIRDLNKTLRRKQAEHSDINHKKIFLDSQFSVMEVNRQINKQDLSKLKILCIAKETINKTKRQPSVWENIFANKTADKGLITKVYKQLMHLSIRTTTIIQSKNGQET